MSTIEIVLLVVVCLMALEVLWLWSEKNYWKRGYELRDERFKEELKMVGELVYVMMVSKGLTYRTEVELWHFLEGFGDEWLSKVEAKYRELGPRKVHAFRVMGGSFVNEGVVDYVDGVGDDLFGASVLVDKAISGMLHGDRVLLRGNSHMDGRVYQLRVFDRLFREHYELIGRVQVGYRDNGDCVVGMTGFDWYKEVL